jgi:hypothetical protein
VPDRWELASGDDRHETGSLFVSGMAGGCSVVWLPAERTTVGTPMLTRKTPIEFAVQVIPVSVTFDAPGTVLHHAGRHLPARRAS